MAKDRLPWFPCYPEKLLGALAGMPPDAGYVYTVVLLRTYEVAGPCPDSAAVLARRTGLPERRVLKALDWLIDQRKLAPSDRGFVNPYAAEVLADVDAHRNSLSTAGKKGASTRWGKDKQKQQKADGEANATEIPNDGYLHLHQHKQVVKKKESPRLREDDFPPDAFDRFWMLYPPGRKGAKKACAAKFDGIRRRGEVTFERMMAGLQRFVDSRPDPQYTKAPEVWLNKGCWDDEYFKGGSNGKTQGADTFAGLAARIRSGTPREAEPYAGGPTLDLEPNHRR